MSCGWTKKFKPINLDELEKMVQDDGNPNGKENNYTVLYFKYVIKTQYGTQERKSLDLKLEDKG